jgi:pyruvate/2-oxoglutarate dehydrogenase complex dihydrolipoamide dehydrogenase (E3) component
VAFPGKTFRLQIVHERRERAVDASNLLVAIGRTPNTESIGLRDAGIELMAGVT